MPNKPPLPKIILGEIPTRPALPPQAWQLPREEKRNPGTSRRPHIKIPNVVKVKQGLARMNVPHRISNIRTRIGKATMARPSGMRVISWQLTVCACLCLLVLGLQAVKLPATNSILGGLERAIHTDTTMDEGLGRLKFVGSWLFPSTEVFSGQTPVFSLPLEGQVFMRTNAAEQIRAIDIQPADSLEVVAASEGQVFYAGHNKTLGNYVRIRHSGGYETLYAPIHSLVKAGDMLSSGERIGTLETGKALRFEVLHNGAPIDPMRLLGLS